MASGTINAGQRALWNGASGRNWVETQRVLDEMFAPFERLLLEPLSGREGGALLDVGCGTGATTLATARASGWHCTGLDISAPMLALARERATQARLDVTFLEADAQDHPFAPQSYDVIVSRFGVMFFADPAEAFSNLHRATRQDGRLRLIAWRSPADNPFMTAAERAVAPLLPQSSGRDPSGQGQFAFADASNVRSLLERGGWSDVDIRPIDVECSIALADLDLYATRLGPIGLILPTLDPTLRAEVAEAARAAFAPFIQGEQVRFTAACWQIDARA
ncbi:MAG: SAM-dependent methyltransferase [Sphingobium sp. SCN 64-10]|nr:MAG: SAM-dependent methyltransferase [Sphingobium sp. SCN 64-10]